MDLSPLFSLSFWFTLQQNALSPGFARAFFIVFALIIIGAAVMRIVARNAKEDRYTVRLYRKIAAAGMTMGFIGLFWLFLAFEEVYLFGARFWFLFWLVGGGVWVYFIVIFAKKKIPALRTEDAHMREANKYLPKKKKRN
jgi:amino acid transporter